MHLSLNMPPPLHLNFVFLKPPCLCHTFPIQGVKEFPFPEATLFKMLVTNFSHCMVRKGEKARRGQEDKSDLSCLQDYGKGQSAAEYINGAFNGQKGFKDHENCDTCGEEKAEKKCSECKSADYCDQVHIRVRKLKLGKNTFRELG